MAYRDNVSALAAELGISNNPSLREEDIRIAELLFVERSGNVDSIIRTDMNRGGRLFFQALGGTSCDEIPINDALRSRAEEYFAELWESSPTPVKRPLIDAIRGDFVSVRIVRKVRLEINQNLFDTAIMNGTIKVEGFTLTINLDFLEVVSVLGPRVVVVNENYVDTRRKMLLSEKYQTR